MTTIFEVCIFLHFDDGTVLPHIVDHLDTQAEAETYVHRSVEGLRDIMSSKIERSPMTVFDFMRGLGIMDVQHGIKEIGVSGKARIQRVRG